MSKDTFHFVDPKDKIRELKKIIIIRKRRFYFFDFQNIFVSQFP